MVLPDIHGRKFWKDVIPYADNATIVFLGDYLDPYPDEGITPQDAIQNFIDIIHFKKEHPNNVILLLGNHDCGYAINLDVCDCRTDYENYEYIKSLFDANHDLFQLAYETTVDGQHYVMTHAGIHKDFAIECFGPIEEKDFVEKFNEAWRNQDKSVLAKMETCSIYRGGLQSYGSIVWADVEEFLYDSDFSFYQIFGHTQLAKDPIITSKFACVDVREPFMVTTS